MKHLKHFSSLSDGRKSRNLPHVVWKTRESDDANTDVIVWVFHEGSMYVCVCVCVWVCVCVMSDRPQSPKPLYCKSIVCSTNFSYHYSFLRKDCSFYCRNYMNSHRAGGGERQLGIRRLKWNLDPRHPEGGRRESRRRRGHESRMSLLSLVSLPPATIYYWSFIFLPVFHHRGY